MRDVRDCKPTATRIGCNRRIGSTLQYELTRPQNQLNAQLIHWGSRGRRFKSCRPDSAESLMTKRDAAAFGSSHFYLLMDSGTVPGTGKPPVVQVFAWIPWAATVRMPHVSSHPKNGAPGDRREPPAAIPFSPLTLPPPAGGRSFQLLVGDRRGSIEFNAFAMRSAPEVTWIYIETFIR